MNYRWRRVKAERFTGNFDVLRAHPLLGIGDVAKKYAVTAHAFSASAQAKIEAAGGSVTVIESSSPDA